MTDARKRSVRVYRAHLGARGLARFEVLAPAGDRDLIRALARRLVEGAAEADRLRAVVERAVAGPEPEKGRILAALRRSPLVDADLDLTRPREMGRPVDL
jgi:hypothetical protein